MAGKTRKKFAKNGDALGFEAQLWAKADTVLRVENLYGFLSTFRAIEGLLSNLRSDFPGGLSLPSTTMPYELKPNFPLDRMAHAENCFECKY